MENHGMKRISIRELERWAIEKYSDCPRQTTVVRHADLEDDSAFHCVIAGSGVVRDFIVPGQNVLLLSDPEYGLFSTIRVRDKDGGENALCVSVNSRIGFLLPVDKVPQ